MESLHLPAELLWDGKLELSSPCPMQDAISYEDEILEEYFVDGITFDEIEMDSIPTKESIEQLTNALDIDSILSSDEDVDNETWMNEKLDIPALEEYNIGIVPPPPPQQQQAIKVENTAQLIKEFECVYDALTQLTPPQSPPQVINGSTGAYTELVINSEQQCQPQVITYQPNQIISYVTAEAQAPATAYQSQDEAALSPDSIARDMQLIDRMVRETSERMNGCWSPVFSPIDSQTDGYSDQDDDSTSQSGSISGNSSGSSTPRSESSYASSNYSNDDEWLPSSRSESSYGLSPNSGVTKKRTRPYGRSSDDRKFRKKEQNKNAATRYRKKKKAEIEIVLEEERNLHAKNVRLQEKLKDVKQEVSYLKKLMRELFVVKGILPA